ncbi:hypothetical protein QUF74_06595 [Candidatus Halobeggiatoa sp. HSG11]|nr:hypothetical protein [Candidatus Halobeggiatoa sp. HSG11]
MSKNRDRNKSYSRQVNTREEKKISSIRELLTFNFKDVDETQPKKSPQTFKLWDGENILASLLERIKDLSKLTRDEAINQQQIKIYGDFPVKTDFAHPSYIDKHVAWGVIEGIDGKKRVAGYIVENTFYIVFLDKEHQFWLSKKKHT